MWHHLAHMSKIYVKEGQKVSRGDEIGKVGSTGSSTAPHVHYEVTIKKPNTWTQYVQGMSKDEIKAFYIDPMKYMDGDIPCLHERKTGSQYLQWTGTLYHPGRDLNSGKDGWADANLPVKSPVDGIVRHANFNEWVAKGGKKNGWGWHVWIEEDHDEIDEKFAAELGHRPYPFFLQVEDNGELWFVSEDGKRTYLHPDNILDWIQEHATGISNKDLNKIPLEK